METGRGVPGSRPSVNKSIEAGQCQLWLKRAVSRDSETRRQRGGGFLFNSFEWQMAVLNGFPGDWATAKIFDQVLNDWQQTDGVPAQWLWQCPGERE